MNRPISARVKTVKASLLTRFTRCQTLMRYRHLASCRCHSALDLGPGWVGSVFRLSPSFTVAHIVRPTAYRYNNVRRNVGYLCVRSFNSSLNNQADGEAQALYAKYELGGRKGASLVPRSRPQISPRLSTPRGALCRKRFPSVASKATVMVMVMDGLKAVPFN